MAKVKINKLPPGFTIKNGKIEKTMQEGGYVTGDQSNYGLVKYDNTSSDKAKDVDVRHSLKAVPRNLANVEAEGGETVLTDLNNDGLFGLYDIKGPRHSKGGVPMNLPDQSFIFSDTRALKLNKKDLNEFGVNSKKKMTPAKLSKKFDLNKYYGAIKEEHADKIQVESAELMMDKNKKDLSKLAFLQESKKNFSDGVPTTAYPYLMSQGIDPIQFTQQVEQISKQRAEQKAIESLPFEQQQQIAMLQQFMGNQPKAQFGAEVDNFNFTLPPIDSIPITPLEPAFNLPENMIKPPIVDQNNNGIPDYIERPGYQQPVESEEIVVSTDAQNTAEEDIQEVVRQEKQKVQAKRKKRSKPKSDKRNRSIDPDFNNELEEYGITLNKDGINETYYKDVQKYKGEGLYGDGAANFEGFIGRWSPIYGKEKMDALVASIGKYGVGQENPEVKAFQNWVNDEYIPSKVQQINQERIDKGYEPLTETELSEFQGKLLNKYGFPGEGFGSGVDGLMGTYTSSRIPIDYSLIQQEPEPEPVEETIELEDPKLGDLGKNPDPAFWLQDMLQLNAIANRERDMFLPWQPAVKNEEADYILEDPTRAIAATNEQLNIEAQALGAFAGPQSQSARMAQAQGRAANNIANEVARVNQRNVGTVNQGLARQNQMNAMLDRERRDRNVKQYDDTQTVLQRYMDEKNFDRESYAKALSNAITNRANTYNLNSIQDYYQIDPTTGGMIGQFSSKAFEPVEPTDPYESVRKAAKAQETYKNITGEAMPNEILQAMITGTDPRQMTNIQRAYNSMPQGYGAAYQPGYYQPGQMPSMKNGGEVKALPFFIGKMGN